MGTRGEAISLRVRNRRNISGRSWDGLRRLAFLTPCRGGLHADREEKRVTRGNDHPLIPTACQFSAVLGIVKYARATSTLTRRPPISEDTEKLAFYMSASKASLLVDHGRMRHHDTSVLL